MDKNIQVSHLEYASRLNIMLVAKSLFDEIKSSYTKALQKNKNFLILLGEDHHSPHSFLFKCIIIEISKTIGLDQVFIEYPEDSFLPLEKRYRAGYFDLIPLIHTGYVSTSDPDKFQQLDFVYRTFKFIQRLKMSFSMIDLVIGGDIQTSSDIIQRNNFMADKIAHFNESCLLVVGASHLDNLSQNKNLSENYHICYIDSSRILRKRDLERIDILIRSEQICTENDSERYLTASMKINRPSDVLTIGRDEACENHNIVYELDTVRFKNNKSLLLSKALWQSVQYHALSQRCRDRIPELLIFMTTLVGISKMLMSRCSDGGSSQVYKAILYSLCVGLATPLASTAWQGYKRLQTPTYKSLKVLSEEKNKQHRC